MKEKETKERSGRAIAVRVLCLFLAFLMVFGILATLIYAILGIL